MSLYGILTAAVGTTSALFAAGVSPMPSLAAGAAVGGALLAMAPTTRSDAAARDGRQAGRARVAETSDTDPRESSGDYGVLRPSAAGGPDPGTQEPERQENPGHIPSDMKPEGGDS